jgi:hypothetical protein
VSKLREHTGAGQALDGIKATNIFNGDPGVATERPRIVVTEGAVRESGSFGAGEITTVIVPATVRVEVDSMVAGAWALTRSWQAAVESILCDENRGSICEIEDIVCTNASDVVTTGSVVSASVVVDAYLPAFGLDG